MLKSLIVIFIKKGTELMQLYYLPIQEPKISEKDSMLLKYVSLDRQHRIEGYKFDIDKKLSLYAQLLLKKCMSTLLQIPPCEIHIQQEALQKPTLISNKNIDFNYSHTRNAILLGISAYGKIGVDIESASPSQHIPNDLHTFFHKCEIEYIENAYDSKKAFFEIWTKKEAYTKYLGLGLSADLVSINMLSSSMDVHSITWQQDSYIYSVYADEIFERHVPLTIVTESDIQTYHLYQ